MKKFLLLFAMVANAAWAVCTATVTNPTAASVQTGIINLTAAVAGCPNAWQAYYQFDDFHNEAPISGPLFTELAYNTGALLDGPVNIRIIVQDATGAVVVTSADVAFSINNFGLVVTSESCSSTNSGAVGCHSLPTVGGTFTFNYSTTHSPSTDLQNFYWHIDGEKVKSNGTTNPPYTLSYDTTQLVNGNHLVYAFLQCIPTATCGTVNGISVGDITRFHDAFVINVQNGTVLRGVQPSLEHITLTVGGTTPLNAVLAQTDGTTTSGTFTLSMEHACIGSVSSNQQLSNIGPICTSGNTWPFTSAEGPAAVSLSSTTLTSGTPITITGLSTGETYLTITDNGSGKAQVIPIVVKDTLAIRHFGSCGTIYSSYTPTGNCPSIFRSSLFNASIVGDSSIQPHIPKVGFTAWEESNWWRDPGNGGGTHDANFAAWQSAWQTNQMTPITNTLAALPTTCYVMRSDGITNTPWGPMTELQLGLSAQGGANWLTDPFPYALTQLQNTNRICGAEQRDEADQGLGFNPSYSMKFSDNSISKIVCKSNICMVYSGTGTYPATQFYAANNRIVGVPVRIRNATTAALNGQFNNSCWYHSAYNIYLDNVTSGATYTITAATNANPVQLTISQSFGSSMNPNQTVHVLGATGAWAALNGTWFPGSLSLPSGTTFTIPVDSTGFGAFNSTGQVIQGACADPATNAEVLDSFTFPVTVADGTYNSGTDPNLEILGWGNQSGYANSGSPPVPNNMISYFTSKFKTAGIPQTWPVTGSIGQLDIITALTWQTIGSTGVSDYHTKLEADGIAFFPWGQAFNQYYWMGYDQKWGNYGNYADPGSRSLSGYWQKEGTGYVDKPQTMPHITQIAISAPAFQMGGIQTTISAMNGSTMTTTAPHQVPLPGANDGVSNYLKALVAGNNDGTMNGNWYVYPLSSTTLRVYGSTNGGSGCTWSAGASGTATVRGIAYTLQASFGSAYGQVKSISGDFPHDLMPGELVVGSGSATGCWNTTWAFRTWVPAGNNSFSPPDYTNMTVAALPNSVGTGGTILANAGQGEFNLLYDYYNNAERQEACSAQVVYAAGQGWAGVRAYAGANLWSAESNWTTHWPNDGTQVQTNMLPFGNALHSLQKRWWQCAPGLNLVNRLAPFYLENLAPSPWISPGPPYVSSTLTQSGTYGNVLNVFNSAEVPLTVSVPLGAYCQIGTNPISIYEIDGVHSTTNLLTGAQTNYSLTMNPGEIDAFVCHAGTASFVRPTTFTYHSPAGTTTTAIQVIYGNYNTPLTTYTKSYSCASATSCTVNIDTNWSNVSYQFQFMNASGAVTEPSSFHTIVQH